MGKKLYALWSIIQTAVASCSLQCRCWISKTVFSITNLPSDSLVDNTSVNILANFWITLSLKWSVCLKHFFFQHIWVLVLRFPLTAARQASGLLFPASCSATVCHTHTKFWRVCVFCFVFLFIYLNIDLFLGYITKNRGELGQKKEEN